VGRPSGRETSSHRWLCPATQQHRCSQTQQVACLPWPCVLRMMVGWAVAGAPELEKGAAPREICLARVQRRPGSSVRGLGCCASCGQARQPSHPIPLSMRCKRTARVAKGRAAGCHAAAPISHATRLISPATSDDCPLPCPCLECADAAVCHVQRHRCIVHKERVLYSREVGASK